MYLPSASNYHPDSSSRMDLRVEYKTWVAVTPLSLYFPRRDNFFRSQMSMYVYFIYVMYFSFSVPFFFFFIENSITIFYLAKEGMDCTFTPLYPEYYMPLRIPFQRGLDQKFFQPSGTGIDVGFVDMVFFEMGELAKSSSEEDIFPLVISVETCSPPLSTNLDSIQPLPTTSPHSQITQAIIEKNKEGQLQVRVIKQILWIDGVRYELHDLYGIGNSVESGFNKVEPGKECSICMTLPKDIAVLPCRHMVRAPIFKPCFYCNWNRKRII